MALVDFTTSLWPNNTAEVNWKLRKLRCLSLLHGTKETRGQTWRVTYKQLSYYTYNLQIEHLDEHGIKSDSVWTPGVAGKRFSQVNHSISGDWTALNCSRNRRHRSAGPHPARPSVLHEAKAIPRPATTRYRKAPLLHGPSLTSTRPTSGARGLARIRQQHTQTGRRGRKLRNRTSCIAGEGMGARSRISVTLARLIGRVIALQDTGI